MVMLVVKNLVKKYGDFVAVDGISFEIEKGEIFGFLGPNGAGKTSTINTIIGLARPTSGLISVAGLDVAKDTKKAQALMGIVADESNLYKELDGFDNLCFCAALYGMSKKEREPQARALLKQFGLDQVGKRPFKAYSKGMKRKLTIAAALIHSPQILFLDEPTTGIDVESSRQIRKMVLELKEQGTTVLLTTHDIDEAERICDRLAFIAEGKIVASGRVSEVMDLISPGHSLRLITDKGGEKDLEAFRASFKDYRIEGQADHAFILTSGEPISLYPLMNFLNERGIEVYEAQVLRPSLEDAFVELTGKRPKLNKEQARGGGQ